MQYRFPDPFSAVVRERSDTHQGSGLAAAEGAELRQLGTEHGGGDGADAGYRAQNAVAPSMLRIVDDDGADRGLEAADLPVGVIDELLERGDGFRRLVFLDGVGERGPGLDQLRARPGEVAEPVVSAAAWRRRIRVHRLAKASQHGRVDGVGLRQLAEGLGEAPSL